MKVLFIQEEFCIRALKQAAALTANGVEVYGLSYKKPGNFYKLEEAVSWFKEYAIGDITKPEIIKQACQKWKIDVIHSHNWPDHYTLAAIEANYCAVVHDTHDMQSLVMEDLKKKFPPHHQQHERDANKLSNGRIYVTEHMAELAEKRYSADARSLVIPCLSSVSFKPKRTLPKLSEKNGKINIAYEGGLVDSRAANHSYYMFDVFRTIITSCPDVKIHVYMSNADPQVIKYYKGLGHSVEIKGKISPFELAVELTQYDYGLALFNTRIGHTDCLATGFANKFGDYILSRVPPIVDQRTPAMHQFITENNCGIACSDLKACIDQINQRRGAGSVTTDIVNSLTYEYYNTDIMQLYRDAIQAFKEKSDGK